MRQPSHGPAAAVSHDAASTTASDVSALRTPPPPDHDQDADPPESGYGERPEEYSPDDFE